MLARLPRCGEFECLRLTCVSNFGDIGKEEDDCQDQDKDGDGEVHPLHVSKGLFVAKVEEDIGAEDWCNHGSDAVEGLGDVDSNLGVTRRAAH